MVIGFHYGFECDDESFLQEWLYAFEGSYRRNWFYRGGQNFSFGKHFRGKNRITADITRKNSLFISAAVQNNHESIRLIYNFFSGLSFNMGASRDRLLKTFEKSSQNHERALKFLRAADTGVCEARVSHIDPPQEVKDLTSAMVGFFEQKFPDLVGALDSQKAPRKQSRLELGHACDNERSVFLPLADESKGTVRALELSLDAFDALDSGGVLIIDELEASLHTLLASKLIELFSSEESNSKQAQLICTTHDTNLLLSDFLRRDQIWFAEKDVEGQTHIYPLTTIKTRNTDNIEKGYLQGRFGAVPFFGRISSLFDQDAA